jgi:hypothetical protein
MPIWVKDLVGLKKSSDASVGRVRKELQDQGQVPRADTLGRERRVMQLCLCGAGGHGRSRIGGNARVGEVVCRVSILLSNVQNKPGGEFAVPSTAHRY